MPSSLSTVLAQDHFYSDFLSLLLTNQIHFESVRMIAFAQHSLSVLTSVKLMIECAVHLLSRFIFGQMSLASHCIALCTSEALGTGYFTLRYHAEPLRRLGTASLPISQSSICEMLAKLHSRLSQKRREYFAKCLVSAACTSLTIPSRPFGYDQV